jgi:hypothetical protein
MGNVRNATNGGTYQINNTHVALTFWATNKCGFKTIITQCISRRLAKFRVSHVCNEAINEPKVTRYTTIVNTALRCVQLTYQPIHITSLWAPGVFINSRCHCCVVVELRSAGSDNQAIKSLKRRECF